jgi:hypothetical protein
LWKNHTFSPHFLPISQYQYRGGGLNNAFSDKEIVEAELAYFRHTFPTDYIPHELLAEILLDNHEFERKRSFEIDSTRGNTLALCTWTEIDTPLLFHPSGPALNVLNIRFCSMFLFVVYKITFFFIIIICVFLFGSLAFFFL